MVALALRGRAAGQLTGKGKLEVGCLTRWCFGCAKPSPRARQKVDSLAHYDSISGPTQPIFKEELVMVFVFLQ